MNRAWNTEKESPRLRRFSGVSEDSSTGGTENMLCRELEESSGGHFGAKANFDGVDGVGYDIRKDMDYEHNESSNSSVGEGVGGLPATYVPFGARPKQIQPLKGYSDSEGEDNEDDEANFVSWQPQQQNKQRQRYSSRPNAAQKDQKHKQKPRDYEIEYEHRPWKRNPSYTSYSSKNSRGSKSSKTSRGSSASRKTPATHFSQYKDRHHHHQQQQRQQQSNTATSIPPPQKLPLSSNDNQEDSVTSFLSQSIHSFDSSDDSSVDGKERNKTAKAKGNSSDDKEGENSDSNHSPPSLDKISAIVDQVHREKQSRLASLQDGNVPVGKLPGGRTAAEPDIHADFGVDFSAGKKHGIGASSFKRSFTASHAVSISDRTTYGDKGERTHNKGPAINQSINLSKLRNNKGKSFSSKDFDRRISLQKESSLRKVTVDIASIASREVEKFYSKRKQEKLEQKQLEMQQRRSDLRFGVGRSESVARLKQADLWSSLNLGESEVDLMRRKILRSSTSSYRIGGNHSEDFNDSVDFGDDDAYEFERVVAEHEQDSVGDTKGLGDVDRKVVKNLSSDGRDSSISLCGIGSPIGESDRCYGHQGENGASQFPPAASPVLPNRSPTFVSASASRPRSTQQPFPPSDAGESHTSSRYKSIPPLQTPPVTTSLSTQTSLLPAAQEASSSAEPSFLTTDMKTPHPTPQSYIASTAEIAPTGRKPILPTAEKLPPPSQSSSLPTVDKTSSQMAPSSSLPTIQPSSQTQTSSLPEALSSDALGTTITTQPLRNISSSSTARYKKRTSLEMVLEAASRASMTGDGDDFAAYPIDENEDPYDRHDGIVQNAASVNRAMSFTSYNSVRSYNSEPVPMKQGAFSTSPYVDRGTGGSGFVPTSSLVDEAKSCPNAAVRRQSLPCKGSKATARRPARNKTIPSGDDYSHDGTNTSGGAGTVGGSVTFSYKDIYGSSEEDLNFISDFPSVMLASAGAPSSSQYWLENGVLAHAVEGDDVAGTSSDVRGVHVSVNVGRNQHDEDDYGFGRRRSSNFEGTESDNARSSMVSIGLDKSNRSLGSSRQSFGSHTISADELDKLIEEEEEGHEPKDNKEKESTSWVKSLKRMSWLPVEMMQQHQNQPQSQQPKLKQRKTQSMYDLHDSDSDGSSKFGSSCSSFSSHSELSCFSNGDMKPMSRDKRRRRRERRRRRTQLNKRTSNLVKENPAPRSIRDILTSTNTGYDTEEEEDTVSVKSSLPSLAAAFGLDKELGKKSTKVPKRRGSHSSQSIQSNSVHSNASRSGQVSRLQVKQSLSEIQPMHPQQKKPSGMGVYFDDRGWRTGGVGYDTSEEDLLAEGMDFTSHSFESSKIADGTVDSTGWEKRLDQCDGDHDHGSVRDHEEPEKIPQEPDYVNETVKDESIHQTKRFSRQSVKSAQNLRLDQSDSSFQERIDELRRSSMAAVENEDPAAFMGVAPKSEKMKNLLKMIQNDESVSDDDSNDSHYDPFALGIREECSRSVFDRDDGGNEHHCHSNVKNSALSAEENNSSKAKPTSDPPAVSTPPPKDGNRSMESERDSNADNGPPSRRISATSQTSSTQSSHSNSSQLSHSEVAQSSGLSEVGPVSAKSRVQSVVESSQSNQLQCKQVTRAEEETHHEDDSSSSPRSEQFLKTLQLSQRNNPQPNCSKDDSSTLHQQYNHSELSKSDHSRQTSTAATSLSLPCVDPVPSKPEDYTSLIYDNDVPLSSGDHQPNQSLSGGLQVSSYPMSLHGGESKINRFPLLLQDQLNEGSILPTCLFQHSTLRHECEIHQILPSPHLCDCEDTAIDIYACHHGLTTLLRSEVDTSSQAKSDRLQNSQPNFHDNAHNQFHHGEDGISIKSVTTNPRALQQNDSGNGLSSNFPNDVEIQYKSDHSHRSKCNCASDPPDSPHFVANADLSRTEHPQLSERSCPESSLELMPHFDVNSVSPSRSEYSKAPQTNLSGEHFDHDSLQSSKSDYISLSQPDGPYSPQRRDGVDAAPEHPSMAQLDSQPSDANALIQSTTGYAEKSSPRKYKCTQLSAKNQDHATNSLRSEHHSPSEAKKFEGSTPSKSKQDNPSPSLEASKSPESNAEKSSRLQNISPVELLESPLSKIDASPSVQLEKLQILHSDKSEQSNATIDVKVTTQVRDDSLSVKSECLQNSYSTGSDNNDSVSKPKQVIHQNEDEKKKLPFLQFFNKSNQQRHNSKESLDEGSNTNPDLSIRSMSSSAGLSQSYSSFGFGSKNGQPLLSRCKDHHSFDNSDDTSKFWPAKDFDRNIISNQSCDNIISEGLNDSAGQVRNLFGIFAKKDCNNCTASHKINEGKPDGKREGSSEGTTDQKSELHQNMSIIVNSIEGKIATDQSNESEAFLTRPRSLFLGRLKRGDHQNISHGKDQLYVISNTNEFSEGSDTNGRQTGLNSSTDDTINLSHYSATIDTCAGGKRNALFGMLKKNRSNFSYEEGKMYDPCENTGGRQIGGTPNQQDGEVSKNGENINSAAATMTSFSMIKGEELISSTTRSTDDNVNSLENENARESLQKAFSTSATEPNNGAHGGNEVGGAKQQISFLNRLQKNKSESERKEDISRNNNKEPDQGVILSQLNDESLNLGETELASTSQQFDGSQFSVCCALGFEVEGRNNNEMKNLCNPSCNPSHSTGNSAALKSPNTNGCGGYSTSDSVENKLEGLLDTDGCACIKDCLSHDKGTGPGTSADSDCDLNPQMKPFATKTSILQNDELRSCCDFSDKASVDSDFYIGTVIVDNEHPDAEGHYVENDSYMDISNTQSSTAFLNHWESPINPNPHFVSDEATPSSAVSRSKDLTLLDSRKSIGDSDNVLSPGICDESMSLHEGENLREGVTNLTHNGVIPEDIGDHERGNDYIEEGLSGDYCPSTDSEDGDVFTHDEAYNMIRDEASHPSSEHDELQPSAGQLHRGTNFSENNSISHPVAVTGMNKEHICNIGSHPDSESKSSEDESSIDLTDVFSNFSSHGQPFIVGKDREEAQVAKTGGLTSDQRKQKERDANIFNNASDSTDIRETDATDTVLNVDDDSYGSSKSGGSVVWPKMFQSPQEVKDNDEGSFSTLHKQASQRSLVNEIFEDSDFGSDGNESVVWPKVSIDSDPSRQPSGQSQNAERNVSIEEYSQNSKYNAEYLVKTKTDVDDRNIAPESSPHLLHPSFRRQQSNKSIATMSTLDSLASPVDQMRAREQAAKGSAHHTMLLERQKSNSSFSSLESYASPTQFLRDNAPDFARSTLVNEEKTADDENALRHYREHYQDFRESNAHMSTARKQSMTSELSYTYEIELRQEFSEQLDELSTSIKGRDSRRFSFRPGRKSSIDSDGSESLESRDIFKATGTLEENNHFARSERSVVSRNEDLQASGFSNNFNMPGGSGMSVYSTDGIEDIDPNATDEGRDDFDFAMEAYANAMKFGHLDQRENDLEDNDHALAAKAYTGLGFARQCKGELDGALDAYMKSLQLWENEVGQDDPDNWDLQFTIGTVLKEMQRQLEASVHFNNALHLLKSRNVASGIHKGSILCTEGMIFSVMDKIDRALDCFRKALLVFQNSHHPLNLKFATIMFEMGSLLSQCDDYDDSANCYKFALEIRKARLGDSFLVARTYYSLGVTLASQEIQSNISTTSSSHLEEALRICQVEFSPNNLQSAIIIHALGVLNERKGDFLAASVWFTKERNMRKALLGPDDESVAAVSSDLGTCYYNSGKYELAILLFRDSLRIKMLLDEDLESLEVADMLYKIASCHDSLCEYGEALHKFHEVKRIREAHYGPNSSPVVQAMLRIGNIQLGKGETKAALECFNEILGIGYANDSINAIEVANSLYGRGCAQLCSFMLNDAMKSFTESLNWKLAALGEDDPGLACIFYQMAHVYLEKSDNEGAITCFEEYKRLQKLEKQRNLHDNAEICFAEGIVAKLQGRTEASLSFYKQALAMFETLFGDEHEKVASIHFEIGCVLASVGDHDSALDHYKLCLEKRRQLLGSHVDVASVLYEIAQVYNGLSNAPLAAEYLHESMEMWKSKLDRVEKLASVCQLGGKMWKVLRRHSEAQKNFEQALELYITIHGQHHETVATTLLDLGELLQEVNQLQQALFCFDECMQIRTDLFGQDDPSVAEVLYSKGVAMLFHKNFQAANDCLSRSLAIREQKLGPKDGAVGDTLNTIGFLQLRMGNIQGDDALNFLNQALEIRKAVGNKSKVVSTLQNIASVYKKRKQYDLCTEVYSDILAVRQEEFGKNDERVADAWINLGNVQTNANRIVEATVSYEEALRIRTLVHSYNHKSVAQVLFKIGSLNSRLNRYAVAKQLFEEYIRIRAEEVDDPDEEMAQALTLMGDLQKETGEKSKAQINWMSAIEIYTQLGYPEDHPKVSKLKSRQSTIPTGLFGTNRKSISSLADMSFGLLG